jgi:hypothetical protein
MSKQVRAPAKSAGNLIVTPVEMLDGSRLSAMALSYPCEGFFCI